MAVSDPHALSLKVLRLSRPTLATQNAVPEVAFQDGLAIKKESSLAYSSAEPSSFPLTPLLTLPAAFGLAYVGESFSCTFCINNELDQETTRLINGIEISATMQTPSNQSGTSLDITRADDSKPLSDPLPAGETLQLILRQDLKESGPHVLAVTITYTETIQAEGEEAATRTRTFRKLYQFVAQQLIAVRSKVTTKKGNPKSWIIEAQLENVGETSVTLELAKIEAQEGLTGSALHAEPLRHVPITLKPQDIEQMMFSVKSDGSQCKSGRRQLARLSVRWRGALGEPGQLSTGWLTSKD